MRGDRLRSVLSATPQFVYVRLRGTGLAAIYAGSYPDAALRWWAARIGERAHAGRDVYAFFNDAGHGHAVRNAATLRALTGG